MYECLRESLCCTLETKATLNYTKVENTQSIRVCFPWTRTGPGGWSFKEWPHSGAFPAGDSMTSSVQAGGVPIRCRGWRLTLTWRVVTFWYCCCQSLSHVRLFATPWTAACQASLSITISPSPGACAHSCPLSRWCHPTISSSVVPFSPCLASEYFSGSQLFTLVGQSIGASHSSSVLPVREPRIEGAAQGCFQKEKICRTLEEAPLRSQMLWIVSERKELTDSKGRSLFTRGTAWTGEGRNLNSEWSLEFGLDTFPSEMWI